MESRMEYLSEAHKDTCNSYVKHINSQIDELKDNGVRIASSYTFDNDLECNLTAIKELKTDNMFAARLFCERLLECSLLTEDKESLIIYELCDILFCIGLFPDAMKKLELLIERKDLSLDIQFNTYLLLGHIHRLTGKIKEATKYYQQADLIYPKGGSNIDYSYLTIIYQQLCVYATNSNDKALEALKPLLNNCNELSIKTKGILYQSLGNIYRSIADYHNAREYFKEAIRLGKEEGDQYKVMERKAELGRVYRSSGCHQKALKRQETFLQFSLSHGYVYSVSAACGYVGFTYYSMGKDHYEKALKYLYTRLQLCKKTLDDQSGYRWSLNNIGKVYLGLKEHEICMRLFEESGDIAKQHGSILGVGTAYGNMGSACRSVGKHQEAITYHKRYLEIAESTLDTGGIVIMQNELILDHLYVYQETQEQKDKELMLETARRYAIQSTRTCVQIRKRLSKQDDLLKIGNFEMNEAKTYSLLQYILILQGLHEGAFLVAEYGRARALADVVREKIKPMDSQFLTDILNISDCDGNLIQEQVALEMKSVGMLLNDLKSHLLLYSIVPDPFTKDTLLYTWHVHTNTTSSKTIVVHFHSSLFNHSNGTEQSVTFDDDYFSSLMREISTTGKYRFIKEDTNNEDTPRDIVPKKSKHNKDQPPTEKRTEKKDKLNELYSILIEPILKHLEAETADRIIVIPQGCLFSVPYSALRNPTSSRYLIQDFVLSLSPSVYLLHLNKHRPITEFNILAVGNPQMPLDEIEQLPGAEKEVVSILSILSGQLLCGLEATKNTVVNSLSRFPIIHLATHAILEDSLTDHITATTTTTTTAAHNIHSIGDYAVKGAIILAKSNEACSGVLTSSEIRSIDLINCRLFVLSCCNTARGKITGDGILGLSRSLMCAGAMNIIVTLWPIQDASTALFMSNFYKQYKVTCDGPSSLRYSMISLIENNYKVEHWAPFCYLGQ